MTRPKKLAVAGLVVAIVAFTVLASILADRGDGRDPVPRQPLAVQLVDGHGLGWGRA